MGLDPIWVCKGKVYEFDRTNDLETWFVVRGIFVFPWISLGSTTMWNGDFT
jgi:hypothetical protein